MSKAFDQRLDLILGEIKSIEHLKTRLKQLEATPEVNFDTSSVNYLPANEQASGSVIKSNAIRANKAATLNTNLRLAHLIIGNEASMELFLCHYRANDAFRQMLIRRYTKLTRLKEIYKQLRYPMVSKDVVGGHMSYHNNHVADEMLRKKNLKMAYSNIAVEMLSVANYIVENNAITAQQEELELAEAL